jgi:hypothetical protein
VIAIWSSKTNGPEKLLEYAANAASTMMPPDKREPPRTGKVFGSGMGIAPPATLATALARLFFDI